MLLVLAATYSELVLACSTAAPAILALIIWGWHSRKWTLCNNMLALQCCEIPTNKPTRQPAGQSTWWSDVCHGLIGLSQRPIENLFQCT